MQKEYGKWCKERTNQKKKKEQQGMEGVGVKERVRILTQERTERRWRVKESEGGL